jgi:hypothetical protein
MDTSSDSDGEEKSKRKRGPYKLYLTPSLSGESVSLPRTTKWRRLLPDSNEENQTEEPADMLHDGTEEIGEIDIPHDNPEESDGNFCNIYETSNASAPG